MQVATKNAADLQAKIDFRQADILTISPETLGKWDIIVSNPPYVPLKDKAEMLAHVKDFEPHLALFVPDENPLLFYQAIAAAGKVALQEGGILLLEIYSLYYQEICEMLAKMGYENISCKADIHGKQRMVRAVR